MNNIKPVNRARTAHTSRHARSGRAYKLVSGIGSLAVKHRKKMRWAIMSRRSFVVIALLVFSFSLIAAVLQPFLNNKTHALSPAARGLLPEQNPRLGNLMRWDEKTGRFSYNDAYAGEIVGDSGFDSSGTARFSASFGSKKPSEGVSITDAINNISFTIKPKFPLLEGIKEENQLVYKLGRADGFLVYTAHVASVKEDIVLESFNKNEMTFDYELGLSEGSEARMENDGSVGVYGSSLLSSKITTSNDKDAELLEKARQKAEKNKLLFRIPAPFIIESDKNVSKARTWFSLEGNILTVHAADLKDAKYPLTIDPSVYIESASKLMRGNNETNIDFDVNNELIQKGKTTGARFNSWTNTLALPSARWNHATAVAGGYIYTSGGNSGSTTQSTVYWSKFNTSTNALESPNPGAGACSNWCSSSVYNLPTALEGHSMVAYNGFLYVMGGVDGSSARSSAIYIAKLGANGEPSLWHPTDSNPNNWVYWYTSSVPLSSERSYASAAAYNNRMYFVGGQTNAASGGVTTVEFADIAPTGQLSSWSTTGMVALPSVRHNHTIQIYNDYLYVIGGNDNGTLRDTVRYIKMSSSGTLLGSWANANSFDTARMAWGGSFSVVLGGYLYISGGCSAINASGYCTTIAGDVQMASINADGSVANWSSMLNVTSPRIGYGLVGWQKTLYGIGGCTSQDGTTGACNTVSTTSEYGVINQDGDASTVGTSVASGTAPCTGDEPQSCNLPGTTNIGNMLSASFVMNGYLYVIGGCTHNTCDTVSGNTAYVAISADGSLVEPASCTGGSYQGGSWCVDSTDPISGGVLAAGVTTFDNRIYIIGGQSGGSRKGNIYHVAVDNDGSLEGPWTTQSFTSIGATSVSYTFAYTRSNPNSASTAPGNLFIFGGCNGDAVGAGCPSGSNTDAVYKCNIGTSGSVSDCSTTGQLQIGTVPGASAPGLAMHAGTVYANYVYLVGGVAPGATDLATVRYARFDNNNNVVAVSGSAWVESPNTMSVGRRRGTSFGYNGYLYTVGGYDGAGGGVLSDIQFAKIDVSNGSIGIFQTSAVTIDQRWGLSVPVSSSYAYVIGGCTAGPSPGGCTARTDIIQTFQIHNNDSGAPANYTSSGNYFPTDRFGAGSTVFNGYLYVAGGCIGNADCNNATNVVEYAALNPDGTIGTWAATTGALPADRVFGSLEVVGGTLYYIGGQDDTETAQSNVYYATPSSGNISSWSTATSSLPAARTMLSTAVWNNRIYVVGGASADVTSASVYISPVLSSGGNIASWTTGTSFNVARSGHTAITYANNLYILGGYDGLNYLSDVQYTQINADGSLDPWSFTTSLPGRVRLADGFAANGYMYIFGGMSSDISCTNNTYVAPLSANTTIDSGNNPTGVGEWSLINERFSFERGGVAATYHEGKAYVLGGACGTLAGGAGTTVITDDFDPLIDLTMWSSTLNMSTGSVCGTVVSGNALYSEGNSNAQAISKDVNVLYGGTISFYLRIPTVTSGACDAPEANEDLVLQYSTNAGLGWTTFATYSRLNYNTPTYVQESIPAGAQTSSTRYRWYIPNADNNQDDWAIDNVEVIANSIPPTEEIMEDDFDLTIDVLEWSSTNGMSVGTGCGTVGSGNALYSTGGNSQAATQNLDMRYGGSLEFMLRMPNTSGGGCDQPESDEDLLLQYSTNNGGTWTTFASYDQALYDPPALVNLAIPGAAWSANIRFRWQIPNAEANADQWAIDDVSIRSFKPRLNYANLHRAVYSTLLSQPQVAKYSRMIDTDTDVFPTKWLLNGLDNDVGARWNMKYRSMTSPSTSCVTPPMTTWGQETNFGVITLGQPEDYIALDGSGTNTNCARFYYLSVSIDSSQAFGYPEDVTRGPTISDLTLFFTSDPGKRLRHGKTFTGGEKQPLNTPF